MGKPRLLERVSAAVQARHYSRRTEEAYVFWIRKFILFHQKRHPAEMAAPEVSAFLEWLATDRRVAASTQNQALSAVLFMSRDVGRLPVRWLAAMPAQLIKPWQLCRERRRRDRRAKIQRRSETGRVRRLLSACVGCGVRERSTARLVGRTSWEGERGNAKIERLGDRRGSRSMTTRALSFALLLLVPSQNAQTNRVSVEQFEGLMSRLAQAWSTQDTELGVSCFTADAVYMQPPDLQLYRGSSELRRLFGALKPGTFMRFHNLSFNTTTAVGFAEFSFGREGATKADHGVVVVEVRGGRIAFWREYFQEGPPAFSAFVALDGKTWKWTIRNYP